MKKTIFVLGLVVFLSGCGRGGGDDVLLASLLVNLSDTQGATTGKRLQIEGGGFTYACSQIDTQENPNDARCETALPGQGLTSQPITFNNLPTGVTYTFRELATGGTPADGFCTITIVDSATTKPPSPFECQLGSAIGSQLFLSIQIV